MTRKLSQTEIEEIRQTYNHLWNWWSGGPDTPIDPLTYVDPTGDSLLHIAAWRGDRRTVELLIAAGIDHALAGLDPAIHVLTITIARKDVDPRIKPGGGDWLHAVF